MSAHDKGCAAWVLVAACLCPGAALAQEDEVEDPGSRTARGEVEEQHETGPATLDLEYDAGLFGGSYVQSGDLGLRADLALSATLDLGVHELDAEVAYLFDSFSMKAFNFAEEDADDTSRRLVQSMHELGGELGWASEWRPWLATGLELRSSYRWTELEADHRWALELEGDVRLGADWTDTGPYATVAGQYFRRIYPNYRVADRALDQDGAEGRLEGGYSFGRAGEVGLAYEVRLTDYFDARYDAAAPGGSVVRSDESKSYLRHSLVANGVWRPVRAWRLGLRYTLQRNDSRNYDRAITGQDAAGNAEPRLIRDYYDYARHRLRASARWHTPLDGLDVELVAEYWVRLFDSYTARDTTNQWLDEERVDHDVDLGLEVSYALVDLGDSTVSLTAFLSHVTRRSNMEREVSFATNFEVTRVFLGLQIEN